MSTVIDGHLYRHRQEHQQEHRGGRRRILQAANLVVSGVDVEREDASGKGVTTEDRRTRQPSESATRRIDKILHQHHASMTGERTDGSITFGGDVGTRNKLTGFVGFFTGGAKLPASGEESGGKAAQEQYGNGAFLGADS